MASKYSLRSVRLVSATMQALEARRLLAIVAVDTVGELVSAVNNGAANDVVEVAPGTYVLSAPLKPKAGMTIRGAGAGSTTLTAATGWNPGTATLPDNGTSASTVMRSAYLFSFDDNTHDVTIRDMKLTAPQLHGALFSNNSDRLELSGLHLQSFLWSGVRTFGMDDAVIRDNTFVDAGGAVSGGKGGAMYLSYVKTSEIYNNRITKSPGASDFFGIKGRQARNVRIHHNTIDTPTFSIELPHEHDYYVEIDHNYLASAISIPKNGGGGTIPSGGYTFHIHHNYFRKSYSLEWAHNGVEVDHNLFDFATTEDGGNLITNFAGSSGTPSNGWTRFHNNLIKNPGRGLYNSNGMIYNNIEFYNNHVIGNTTVTPRTEGMFGLPTGTDFSTIRIRDNLFQFNGQSRPLFRNSASYASQISNNTLTNVSDAGLYANPNTGATRGPTAPLNFAVGVGGEYTVSGWTIAPSTTQFTIDRQGVATALGSPSGYDHTQDGQNGLPTASTVQSGGDAVLLTGNAWKRWGLGYSVTSSTVLQFTVDSVDAGEILAVALDNDTTPLNGRRTFRFGGAHVGDTSYDSWSWRVAPTYTAGSGPRTYTIDVGSYFTGSVSYLGLVADDDADGSASARFSDLRIYEAPASLTLAAPSSYGTLQDGQHRKPTSAQLSDGGRAVTLAGNAWKRWGLNYKVTADTILQFTVNSLSPREILGIALDSDTNPTRGRRAFRLGGTDAGNAAHDSWSWAIAPQYAEAGRPVTYRIPVGKYFTGDVRHLGLFVDDDATGAGRATFSSIRLYNES
jgi:hypothetical protein